MDVGGFTTSFRFQVGDAPSWWHGDGLTFVLQNAGPAAVGAAGGGLGYAGIAKSVAVKFDLVDNAGEGTDSVGVFTGGAEPTTPADRLPPGQDGAIHLNSGHVFRADLAYADGTLRVELLDTETGQGFRRSYAVDVPAAVGGPTAYAGFTAGTGEPVRPDRRAGLDLRPDAGPGPGPARRRRGPEPHGGHGGRRGHHHDRGRHRRWGYGGDGGPAASAALDSPAGVAADAAGNLFIADTGNHRVRRVDAATGVITTVAGTGTFGYAGDGGPATSAALAIPSAVAVDAAGNLFIADAGNSRVRRVDAATGVITTVAGTGAPGYGGDGGPATGAALNDPSGWRWTPRATCSSPTRATSRVRRVDAATGVITTVAGTGAAGYGGDGGPATAAALNYPAGVAVDAAGNLFIADTYNHRVRRVDAATGVITTVAGTGAAGLGGDGGPGRRRPPVLPRRGGGGRRRQPVHRRHSNQPGPAGGRGHRGDHHRGRHRRRPGTAGTAARPPAPSCGWPMGWRWTPGRQPVHRRPSNNRVRRVAAAAVPEGGRRPTRSPSATPARRAPTR